MAIVYSPYQIRFFRSVPPFSFNLQHWENDNTWAIFIIGLSGAGKTSFSEELKTVYGCPVISLDALRFYSFANQDSQTAVDGFLALYPNIEKMVKNHWETKGAKFSVEREYTKYTVLFLQFLERRAKATNQKYIIEGIQPFVRFSPKVIQDSPIIVLGRSSISCFIQATKRDFSQISPKNIPELIVRFWRYSIVQKIRLNKYLFYWTKRVSPHPYQKRQSTKNTLDAFTD